MAVVRIKLRNARDARLLADAVDPVHSRAGREIRRAATRPGLTAELTAEEATGLAGANLELAPRFRSLLAVAAETAASTAEWERARPRAYDLVMQRRSENGC